MNVDPNATSLTFVCPACGMHIPHPLGSDKPMLHVMDCPDLPAYRERLRRIAAWWKAGGKLPLPE
jgi:hypothetical protein